MRRKLALVVALGLVGSTGCTKIVARDLVREGNQLYGDGRYEESIEKFSQAMELEPDGITVFWNRAAAAESLVLQLQGTEDEGELEIRHKYADMALDDFREWHERLELKTEEDDKAFEDNRLAVLQADERCDDLVAHWSDLHQQKPNDEGLYTVIARTYEDVCGKPDLADEWFVKRTSDFPDSPKAWYALATRRFEPLFPDPESMLPVNTMIDAETRIKIADEVIGYLQQATQLDGTYRDPYVWRSMAYTQQSLAREYIDPPIAIEDKLLAIRARQDSMLAWRETKAVCDIDKIPDCAAIPLPQELFADPASFAKGEVQITGKVDPGSVKQVDEAKQLWSLSLTITYEPPLPEEEGAEGEGTDTPPPPPPEEGAEAEEVEPVKVEKKIDVTFTFFVSDDDSIDISDHVADLVEHWKTKKRSTFSGKFVATGEGEAATYILESIEKPIAACCPLPVTTPEEEVEDKTMLEELLVQQKAEREAAEKPEPESGKRGRER